MKIIQKMSLMLLVCVCSTIVFAQESGYSIRGFIKDVPDGTIFYLIRNKESGGADTISKAKSKNGSFFFKGSLKLSPEMLFVKIDTSTVKVSTKAKTWTPVLLENATISLTGNLKDWPSVKVKGSLATSEYLSIIDLIRTRAKEINFNLLAVRKDSWRINQIKQEWTQELSKMLESYADAYATPLLVANMKLDAANSEKIYNGLTGRVKNSFYGEKLKNVVLNLQMQEKVAIGRVIPEFFITTDKGERRSIVELAKKSKYTLIDFWAYWCQPCRKAIPGIKKVYETFKDQGFNVVAVSTDPNLLAWKKALKEEGTSWINGIQEGDASKAIFALRAIPGYILLNEKAEIMIMDVVSPVAKSNPIGQMNDMPVFKMNENRLHGDGLYKVIEELLGKKSK